jgi:hypothetical protein
LLSSLSGLIPIIFFLVFFQRNREIILWVIFLYTVISFCTDLSYLILHKYQIAKFYIFSSFTIFEYSLFTIFFYLNLKSNRTKKFILVFSCVFFLFGIYSMIKSTNHKFDSLPASIESVLIISYCIFFLYEQLRSPENSFVIYSSKEFWITIAIFIFVAATLFLFISTAYISEDERHAYWPINYIANIIKNLLLTIALILKGEKSISNSYHKSNDPQYKQL